MLNFASQSGSASTAGASRKVMGWIRSDVRFAAIVEHDPMVQVMVSEVQCFDEGCVPLETLAIIVTRDCRWMGKLLMPLAEVTQSAVAADLNVPSCWWLYTMLFLLRQQEPELSASTVTSAYDWIVERCGAAAGSGSLLQVLETLVVCGQEAEREQAATSLLLLSKCLRLSITASSKNIRQETSVPTSAAAAAADLPAVVASKSASIETPDAAPVPAPAPRAIAKFIPPPSDDPATGPVPRHAKNAGVRQRGCPCCDPDNIDNVVDQMFMRGI